MINIFRDDLERVTNEGLLRKLTTIDDREITLYCSNNYLGLATHPAIKKAATDCVEKYGWGAGASRLVSGNMEPHRELEERIATFCQKESALLFSSGYQANVGLLTALLDRGDALFADRLCHASILDGARWSGATLKRFRHNDPDSLVSLLKKDKSKGKKLIVTEGVFSMDGDKAPLKEIADIAERFGAIFMLDDAHGFGLYGDGGRGTAHEAGVIDRVDILVVTLGKALGGSGGVILGSQSLIDGLINFSRPFIYSTGLPPAVAGAGVAAIDLVEGREGDNRRLKLFGSVAKVRAHLAHLGCDIRNSMTQIIPLMACGEDTAVQMSARLLEEGVYIPAIRYPTVPRGEARLRLTLSADQTDKDLKHLCKIFDTIFER